MEFKGTKGIWSTEKRNDKYDGQATIRINSSFGIDGLCTIWSGSDKLDETTIADAQLISAAPDLLEALQNTLIGFKALIGDQADEWIEVIEAEKAINKALVNDTKS